MLDIDLSCKFDRLYCGCNAMRLDREQRKRVGDALREDLGKVITQWLEEPTCEDIVLNPDGRILVKCLHRDWQHVGDMNAEDAESVIVSIAAMRGIELPHDRPILETVIPFNGSRFEGVLAPVSDPPVFSIRKRAKTIYTLADYVRDEIATQAEAAQLKRAVQERKTILVSGATGSGKTTLLNALVHELPEDDRILILEETPELQCSVKNCVPLLAHEPHITLANLLCATLRMRPSRIVVGEVRGGEALAMLKAFNTGHPGGLSTIHANDAEAALLRLNSLVREAIPNYDATDLIRESIQMVVQIDGPKLGVGRRISYIFTLNERNEQKLHRSATRGA